MLVVDYYGVLDDATKPRVLCMSTEARLARNFANVIKLTLRAGTRNGFIDIEASGRSMQITIVAPPT